MDTLWQDIRYGIRTLVKNPGFAVVAVLTLALGIGATSTIFEVVNAILLRPLPYSQPDRLVALHTRFLNQGAQQSGFSVPELNDLKERGSIFEHLALMAPISGNLTGTDKPERIQARAVSGSFFTLLGAEPMLGRTFSQEDESPGITQILVISYSLWQRHFGGDPGVIGKAIRLDNDSYTIMGVMPAGFQHPAAPQPLEVEAWYPAGFSAPPFARPVREDHRTSLIARLKPEVTLKQAKADLDAYVIQAQRDYPEQYPGEGGWSIEITPLHDAMIGKVGQALLILFGATVFVLLIACANVANLLMARASARQQEIAIRSALGATRRRLIRQLLTESLILAGIGGILGLILAVSAVKALVALSPADIPRLSAIQMDFTVLVFILMISLATAVVFGLLPAFQTTKVNLNERLKESGRGAAGGPRSNRLRGMFVVSEFAFALVLLVGAGLLIRSFQQILKVNSGFDPSNVLAMEMGLPFPNQPETGRYFRAASRIDFYQRVLDRIEALPGIQSASLTSILPLSGDKADRVVAIEGQEVRGPEDAAHVEMRRLGPGYFRTMSIPLLAGRDFTKQDDLNAPPVAVVNETMARRFWPDGDVIGRRFKLGALQSQAPWVSIIGIAKDVKSQGLDAAPQSEAYLSYLQGAPIVATLVIKSTSDPVTVARFAENEIRAVDNEQPVFQVRTLNQVLSNAVGQKRFSMSLLTVFAVLALILAAVGIYGVTSFSVTQRSHEIAIRIAMGAQKRDIIGLILKQGATLMLIGIGIGLIAAFILTRAMSSLLFGVTATDPITFAIVPSLLTLVAIFASYIPSRNATRVDPVIALRQQ